MKDMNITKYDINKIIKANYHQHYCVAENKDVDENCYIGCCIFCRYREVKLDEDRIAKGEKPCVGYVKGKWGLMPNYHCVVQSKTTIIDVPDFVKQDKQF